MKRILTVLTILLGFSFSMPSFAQENDEQMINASLRFIMENAGLTKKEYQKFAKIYIAYNEQLAKLNRELKSESGDYMKRWSAINDDYMDKLSKALPDSTRQKIGVAQFQLGQKIWQKWSDQNREHLEQQMQAFGQWNRMNPQFMMAPHMFDFQRMQQMNMEHASQQQHQWWNNYWRNWEMPDSATLQRMEENRKRYDSYAPRFGNPAGRGFVPGVRPGGAPGGVPGARGGIQNPWAPADTTATNPFPVPGARRPVVPRPNIPAQQGK